MPELSRKGSLTTPTVPAGAARLPCSRSVSQLTSIVRWSRFKDFDPTKIFEVIGEHTDPHRRYRVDSNGPAQQL
ncbi:MAG TPA: hypothetical protein VFC16_19385 [Nakamurella sp.]|nr:hypothetical protein [Nakamurella sp.]